MKSPDPQTDNFQRRCTHESAIIGPQGQTLSCPECEAERAAEKRQVDQTTRRTFNANLRKGLVTLAAGLEVADKAGLLPTRQERAESQLTRADKLPEYRDSVTVNLQPVQIILTAPPVTVTYVPPEAEV